MKSGTNYKKIELTSYKRFQWFWMASHGFSVRDLINALAECVCELAEHEEGLSGDDLGELYELNYLTCKNLDIALEELGSTSMTDLFRAVAECANHLLLPNERIDSDEMIELFEETGLGQGSLYPCLDEFLGAEYQDNSLMRQLLDDQEYAVYLDAITEK